MSRFDYVSNVMRATMPSNGSNSSSKLNSYSNSPNASSLSLATCTVEINPSHASLFHLVQDLYLALDELAFPFPVGLHTKFVVLGFHTTNKWYVVGTIGRMISPPWYSVFLQYLDHGLFRVTDSFMKHALDVLHASEETRDIDFLFKLMTHIPNMKKLLRLLKPIAGGPSLLAADYLVSELYEKSSTYMVGWLLLLLLFMLIR